MCRGRDLHSDAGCIVVVVVIVAAVDFWCCCRRPCLHIYSRTYSSTTFPGTFRGHATTDVVCSRLFDKMNAGPVN